MRNAHIDKYRSVAGRTIVRALIVFSVIGISSAPGEIAAQEPAVPMPQTPSPLPHWVDADGNPLPFYTEEQVEEFLRTAEVTGRESLPVGVTDPVRVTLEKDGTVVHGVFRYLDTTYNSVRMADGRVRANLKDSCHFEPAAYELSKMLNMDNVPPAIGRRLGPESGSLQIWVYGAMMESDRVEEQMQAPNRLEWIRQVHTMYLFDALIGNDDRTQQNMLYDENWKLWLIDHTRAFYPRAEAANLEKVTFVERGFWEGLRALDPELLEEKLGDFLSGTEIEQLLERRERVAEHVRGLIETRGEGAVIYQVSGVGGSH